MPIVSKTYTFSAGAIIVASEHNTNFDTLYNLVNGNLNTANLAAGAGIVDTQLATISTASKVNTSALTGTIAGANIGVSQVEFIVGDGINVITTGIKGDIKFPFACTISSVECLADQSGSIVFDLWKDTYANYPPTVADTITASAKPTISSATKATDATLTGWTTSVASGDIIRVNVDSITTCTRVAIAIKFTRV